MRAGKEFLRTLNKYSVFGGKLLPNPLSNASKAELPKQTLTETVMKVTSNSPNNIKQVKLDPLQEYIEHLKKLGTKNINYIGEQIKKYTRPKKNIDIMLKTVIDDYVTMLQSYYLFVTEDKTDSIIDKEYLFLDVMETSNKLLYGEEMKLLDNSIMGLNIYSLNNSFNNMYSKIHRQVLKNKKEEIQYICSTYDVCRLYPGFSDYCAGLIYEILKLPENKSNLFLATLATTLKLNENFFATISEKEDRELILATSQRFTDYTIALRQFLENMRAGISQRFKILHGGDKDLEMRSKALRILIDIIDRALSLDAEIISIDIDIIVHELKAWSSGARETISHIVKEFVNHVIRILDHNLSKNTRKEISVLIELITRSSTTNMEVYQELFKYGSKYVQGNDIDASFDGLVP